jgi:O-antigen/teichoic acid export membrane protein
VYTLLLNLLLSCGLLLLKRETPSRPELAGYFGAAQTMAVLSYQAVIAIIFVVFPLVSRATFQGDKARTRETIARGIRYSFILAAAIGVVLAAKPDALLRVPYRPDFAAGGPALRALALGFVAFSVAAVAGAILNGGGQTGAALLSIGATLAIAVAANLVVLPGAADPLRAAAWATAGAMAVGMVIALACLRRGFGAALPWASGLKIGIAGAAALAGSHFLPNGGKLVTLAECAVVGLLYLGALAALGELSPRELRALARREANS